MLWQGTSSIRSFFKTCDPSSFRKQEHAEAIQLQGVQAAESVGNFQIQLLDFPFMPIPCGPVVLSLKFEVYFRFSIYN